MNQFLQQQEILLSVREVRLRVRYDYCNKQRRLRPKRNYQAYLCDGEGM
jgi:hypothetical protein